MMHIYDKYLTLYTSSDPNKPKYELLLHHRDNPIQLLYRGYILTDLEEAIYKYKQEQYAYLDASKLEVSNNTFELIEEARNFEFKR